MQPLKDESKIWRWWYWIVGPLAFFWVVLRSGTNPKRLTYPCQQAAMPVATHWILAVIAFVVGSVFLRRFAKFSAIGISLIGIIWFIGALPELSRCRVNTYQPLPIWEVADPVSTIFVLDSLPPTTGSLAAGDASVPDEYLPDPAMDSLLVLMAEKGVYLHQTATQTEGIVGADNVVIIKGNFQWHSQNTTNTDRIKGLIRQILNHPDGFTGEIIVCDNTQDIGTGINALDNNSDDPNQSLPDVVNTFYAKGYPVYYRDWNYIWNIVVTEYSDGDFDDGYVYEEDTKVTYPKFQSPSGDYRISLRYGLYDWLSGTYDPSRLCIIDFPVLKAHSWAGATIAVKNWIGVLTTAFATQRYGGFNQMHNDYFFGPTALVARVMAATYPRLTIVDATWTTTFGPNDLGWLENTKMLVASTGPAAASWYAAKFILTPIARYPTNTDPDLPTSPYHQNLESWTTFLADSAGLACTMDSSKISVFGRRVPCDCTGFGDLNLDGGINPIDAVLIVNFVYKNIDDREQLPYCPGDNGDWDCDGEVNPLDAVQYVNYVYKSIGEGPCNPCEQ